jgi:hypothetical protein
MPQCPDLNLRAPTAELPRLMNSQSVVKNLSTCQVPEQQRDAAFWDRCGEKPIDANSNIFLGFDKENWTQLTLNIEQIRQAYIACKSRVDEVNRQRREWRELNQQARAKSGTLKK